MSATTEKRQCRLDEVRRREHGGCVVCGSNGGFWPKLEFEVHENGSVRAVFDCNRRFRGYADRLHGGVISLLLDGAMTHCLFARGIAAVTGEMTVRYVRPVAVDMPAEIEARVTAFRPPYYRLEAVMSRSGEILARAAGKFLEPDSKPLSKGRPPRTES